MATGRRSTFHRLKPTSIQLAAGSNESLVEVAARSPRARFGVARRSRWNTSFDDGPEHIRFFRYGRVPLDFSGRLPLERFLRLKDELNCGQHSSQRGRLGIFTLRGILQDLEASVYHWVSDEISAQELDISDRVVDILGDLSAVIGNIQTLNNLESKLLHRYISVASPDLSWALTEKDELDALILGGSAEQRKRGRRRKSPPKYGWFVDALIDDWKRQTRRPVTQGTGDGSVRAFYLSALKLMVEFPPPESACVVREGARQRLRTLNLAFDEPLEKAIRGVATAKPLHN